MRGIMLRSNTSDNEIKDNRFDGNRVGILLFGPLDTTIKDNVVSTSTVVGIRVNFPATGNVLAENLVTISPIGIDFLVGPAGRPSETRCWRIRSRTTRAVFMVRWMGRPSKKTRSSTTRPTSARRSRVPAAV